jgi:hypothetical protein
MSAKKEIIPLSRELKLLLLNVLKNGSISIKDVTQINILSGFELSQSINQYKFITDEELDNKIKELESKKNNKNNP